MSQVSQILSIFDKKWCKYKWNLGQNDCQSIENQINLNLNNTPFIFTPITNQTCVNHFLSSSHQLRVKFETFCLKG